VVAFRDFVRALAPGRAILFSSHIVAEVAEISDRIVVIHRGRIVADDAVQAFRERAAAAGRSLEDEVLAAVREAEAPA
jgi:ABC-2 type transport system ATP-binding protein